MLASAMGALTATLLVVSPAHAGETQRNNTSWEGSTAGYAAAQGTVGFPSRRSFDLRGWVKDVCGGDPDGDGRGAYATVHWTLRGDRHGAQRLGKDTNGCGNGRTSFDPPMKKFARIVRQVTIIVCEKDTADPDVDYCSLLVFDNPWLG
jgi:hypothetical protein